VTNEELAVEMKNLTGWVKDLATKIDGVHETLRGNGTEGLMVNVALLQQKQKTHDDSSRALRRMLYGTMSGVVIIIIVALLRAVADKL